MKKRPTRSRSRICPNNVDNARTKIFLPKDNPWPTQARLTDTFADAGTVTHTNTHRYRYNCRDLLCLYGSIAHTYPCIYSQVRERRSLYLNALKFAATTEPPTTTTTTTVAVSRNWDIHKILPGNDLQSMRILNALHSCRS